MQSINLIQDLAMVLDELLVLGSPDQIPSLRSWLVQPESL